MIHVVEKAFDIGFNNVPIAPVLKVEGEVLDRMLRASTGTITVTAIQKVFLIDGSQQFRTCQLHEFVFKRRYPQRPFFPVLLGNPDSPNQFSPVLLFFQPLCQSLDVAMQVLRIVIRRYLVYSTGGVLVKVGPASKQVFGGQFPLEVTKAVVLVAFRLLCYSPQ